MEYPDFTAARSAQATSPRDRASPRVRFPACGFWAESRVWLPALDAHLYVGTTYCPKIDSTLIFTWVASRKDEALARERQSQVGCPGEESRPVPQFRALADAAFRAGDAHACEVLKQIG